MLFSAFNQTTSSNKQKNEAWKKINQAVTAVCPQELPKDAVLTKKNTKILGGRRCMIFNYTEAAFVAQVIVIKFMNIV